MNNRQRAKQAASDGKPRPYSHASQGGGYLGNRLPEFASEQIGMKCEKLLGVLGDRLEPFSEA